MTGKLSSELHDISERTAAASWSAQDEHHSLKVPGYLGAVQQLPSSSQRHCVLQQRSFCWAVALMLYLQALFCVHRRGEQSGSLIMTGHSLATSEALLVQNLLRWGGSVLASHVCLPPGLQRDKGHAQTTCFSGCPRGLSHNLPLNLELKVPADIIQIFILQMGKPISTGVIKVHTRRQGQSWLRELPVLICLFSFYRMLTKSGGLVAFKKKKKKACWSIHFTWTRNQVHSKNSRIIECFEPKWRIKDNVIWGEDKNN